VFCDRCGLNFLPKQSTCTRCKSIPTRYWFQLMGLITLFSALACNALIGLYVLPRLMDSHHPRMLFRIWLWIDQKSALYGWVPLALGLLAWDYLVWKEGRPKVKGWLTRKLLTVSLAAGIAPILPWWIPAGQPPGQFLSFIGRYAGVPTLLAWLVVVIVAALVCIDPDSRDSLLGHGKVLNLVSLGFLLLIFSLTAAGWAITYTY